MQEYTPARCPDCGAARASERALSGLCPQCLFSLALVDSEAEELPTLAGGKSPAVGEILGERYQIRAVLGQGGQGEVFRAFDLKLRVDVALKALRAELVRNERALELLRGEVRSAREVVSANVCRVFDLVVEDGRELVSMEYIDGTTLSEIVRSRGPLELSEAREIASQFLSGLEAIHEAGLVHRDLKPENIMRTRSGRVVVMDFGIAKALGRGKKVSTIAGTPGYMAPEQARGESVDARADVFSAGVVLAEMTSGARNRAEREELWRLLRESPPKVPETPWAPVLVRALAWDRNARYASARDLARALEEVTLRLPGFEEKSPYPGLASFTEEDAHFFFGRELDVEALWKKLKRPRLLALIGPSGAGKSSFLRAGLLTALPEGWSHVLVQPGNRPFQSLARALVPHFSGENDAMELLLRFEDRRIAVELVQRWRKKHSQAMVVVDQFEELFTLNRAEVQQSFAELLGRLALEADVHVLLSTRDDFLFHCQSQEALSPIFSELTPLGALRESAMRRALIQPALACGYRFEDESLVDEMVAEVAGERGALPLLAFAASKLWERRDRQQGLLTREAYEHIGGVGGSLAQHAESTLEKIGRERVPIVRELFRNLVTAQGTRAARDREKLLALFEGEDEERKSASQVLDQLVDARLLTSYEVAGRESETHQIEIIHESLLSAWPRLVHWQTQDAEGAQLRDELRQAAQMWEQRNRSDDVLWTGSAFQEFQLWRDRYPGSLTPIEEAFGRAMASRAARRTRNRRIALTAAFALLLGVAGAIGGLWRQSERARAATALEARRAEASRILTLGQLELLDNPPAALAFALKSLELADTHEARVFALKVLQQAPMPLIMTVETNMEAHILDLSPDGAWLAVAGYDRVELRPRDGGSARLITEYPTTSGVFSFAEFGPEGDRLVTDKMGDIRFFSIPEGKELRRQKVDDGPSRVIMRPDGFFSSTTVGEQEVIRRWTLDEKAPVLVGRLPKFWTSDIDRSGTRFAYTRGRSAYIRSLLDWSVPPRAFSESQEETRDVTFHPDGRRIAVSDSAGTIRLVSSAPGSPEPLRVFEGKGLRSLYFDSDGTTLVAAGVQDGRPTARLWDLAGPPDAEPLLFLRGDAPYLNDVALDPSGQWLLTANVRSVAFWPLSGYHPRTFAGHGGIQDLAFTPDATALLSASADGTIRSWPLSGANEETGRILFTDDLPLVRMDLDPRGERLLVAGRSGRLFLVTLGDETSRPLLGFSSSANVMPVAFDPATDLVAAALRRGPKEEKVIRVWDLESGDVRVLGPAEGAGDGFQGGYHDLEFLPGDRLLSSARGSLRIWNVRDGTDEVLAQGDWMGLGMAASQDGRHLLYTRGAPVEGEWGELVRLDLEKRTSETLTSHGSRLIAGPVTDPAGTIVVTGDLDGVVRVGPVTGEEPHLLLGHKGPIRAVAVSADGRWIASAGEDHTIRLWPMPEGPPFHTLPYEEIVRRLRSVTNVRVVEDQTSSTGYSLGLDPFPGWEKVPKWWDSADGSR